MDFDLSDDHELIRRTVREFAEGEIAPVAEELDRTKSFPYAIVAQLGELGLMGIPFPEEVGGAGGDSLAYAIAVEELARVDSSVAITMCAHTSLGTQPVYLFGSAEQQSEWLPELCAGRKLGAFGLTEPEAGSDAGNVRTRARLDGGEWVIDGAKQFITNAGTDISGIVCITARTGDDEISNLIVPNGTAGYEQGEPYRKMGWNASDTRPLVFEGCRVPEENLLGPRGAGFRQFLTILDIGRIGVAAMGVGLAQGALDQALAYAKERRAFGQPISKFQAIQAKLADMATEIEAARLLTYKAARLKDADRSFTLTAAQAKLKTGPARGALRRGGGPDPRRLRLHRGVPGVPVLPRREDPHDRRGHRRGAADGHRARARGLALRGLVLWAVLFAAYAATIGVGGYAEEERHFLVAAASLADGGVDLTDEYAAGSERRSEGGSAAGRTWLVRDVSAGDRRARRRRAARRAARARLPAARRAGLRARRRRARRSCSSRRSRRWRSCSARGSRGGSCRTRGRRGRRCSRGSRRRRSPRATAVLPGLTAGALLAGAALCALAVRERPLMRSRTAAPSLLALLPWLDPWLLVPAAPVAALLARWTARRGRGLVALGTLEVQLASLVFYVSLNDRLYGGFTPLAAGDGVGAVAARRRLRAPATRRRCSRSRCSARGSCGGRGASGSGGSSPSSATPSTPPSSAWRSARASRAVALVVPGASVVAALPCAVAPMAWGFRRAPRAGLGARRADARRERLARRSTGGWG